MFDARRRILPGTDHDAPHDLRGTYQDAHPGLILHRYLQKRGDKGKVAREMLAEVADMSVSHIYEDAFKRWQTLQATRPQARLFSGTLAAPLAVGLGNASVTEVGLTLHHTYGMPFIPGSALKGLCRRAAAELKGQAPNDFLTLFGDTTAASHLVFWDAWYDPASAEGYPFLADTITVHHPQYYSKRGAGVWPTDFDDPNPVPFLSVRPGAKFLFALDAPSHEWADFAQALLTWGLVNLGVGSKTNAGYGYFAGTHSPTASASTPTAPTQPKPGGTVSPVPPPPPPRPPQQAPETKKEWVTLAGAANGGRGQVQVASGEIVPCTNIPYYQSSQRFRANVSYEGGQPRRAVFSGWK